MDNFYEKKYLKYKIKFLKLKQIGGFTISWPNDISIINNLIDKGIINFKIISENHNSRTSTEFMKQTLETLPGLMGIITSIDENKLIMSDLKDNKDIIKVKEIEYNKQNVLQVKLEPYIKNGDKLEPYISEKEVQKKINNVEDYCNKFIKYHTKDGKEMLKIDYDELIAGAENLRMTIQEIKYCIGKKKIKIISPTGTEIPYKELGIDETNPNVEKNTIDRGSPVATIDRGSPVATIDRGSPVATIDRGSPVATIDRGSPVATIDRGSPVATLTPGEVKSKTNLPSKTTSDTVVGVTKPYMVVGVTKPDMVVGVTKPDYVSKPDYSIEIKTLEDRLKKLENKFNNHYHDIPTTGVREFDVQHPFYKNP